MQLDQISKLKRNHTTQLKIRFQDFRYSSMCDQVVSYKSRESIVQIEIFFNQMLFESNVLMCEL